MLYELFIVGESNSDIPKHIVNHYHISHPSGSLNNLKFISMKLLRNA